MMKDARRHITSYVAEHWRAAVAATAIIGSLLGLLAYKLGSLVGGLSDAEFTIQQAVAKNMFDIGSIVRDPLYLPYDIALYIVQLSPFHGPTAIRMIGVGFAVLGAIGFFSLLRRWYTTRMACFGTVLFVTSTWFVHSARVASPDVSYLLLPLLIAVVVSLQAKVRAKRFMLAATAFGFGALYIPGVIWFLLPAVILERKTIITSLKLQPLWFKSAVSILAIIMTIPAVAMIVAPLDDTTAISNVTSIVGLPDRILRPQVVLDNASQAIAGIFAVNTMGPGYTIGRVPWLDVSTTALVAVGIMQFVRYRRLARSKLLGIIALTSIILIALGGVSSLILLPFVYLLAVEGLKRLLGMWLTIFPKNPFARSFGVVMIALLVAGISYYHITRYYIAWSSAPETRQYFNRIP